jgi:NADPH2:quinone reductase
MQSLRCMAPEGRIMPVGFAGGEIPQIPANLLLVKNLTVCGLNLGYYYGWSPQDVRAEYEPRMRTLMQQLFDWCLEGRIRPQVAATYPLDEFQQAMADVLGRNAIGRVAVLMGED